MFSPVATMDASQRRAQSLRSGAELIADARPRTKVTLAGVVTYVVLHKRGAPVGFAADLDDGSGTVRIQWHGQVAIPGIVPGRPLMVRGTISTVDGVPTMYNPRYELLATVRR